METINAQDAQGKGRWAARCPRGRNGCRRLRPMTCGASSPTSSTRSWPTASAGPTPTWSGPQKVAVGRDVRPSGEALVAALARGLNDGGVDVLDIGLCGTEQVYFATFHLGLDGGIMVTASHNPAEYNGMKFVRERRDPHQRRQRPGASRSWPAPSAFAGRQRRGRPDA